jgi:putative methylase
MKKKELELILENLKPLEKPKVKLEQYTVPAYLAAEILNLAHVSGDIEGKFVVDLGCGSGRLAIGAALLGAKKAVGVDLDAEAIKQAEENLKIAESLIKKKLRVEFVCCNIEEWDKKCDTVVQNPPFGTKGSCSDKLFLEKATSIARKVYSLHKNGRKKTREFLEKFVSSLGCRVENVIKFSFYLPHTFRFHRKPKVRYDVDLYVISC